jgi:hypothetical protein
MKPSFTDFINALRYNKNPNISTDNANIIADQLQSISKHFINATNIDSDGLWITTKETKNTVTIHTTDSTANTIIPIYAFIITPNKIYDKMVLKSIKITQGTDYNNDLDEITATYQYRNNLIPFEKNIISTFNNLLTEL